MPPNPFRPGVGKPPPYLADREQQLTRFSRYLADFPAHRRNVRVTGLRGVGKTVLLKEYRRTSRERDWVVIRRDLSPRLNDEAAFITAIASDLQQALETLSAKAKLGRVATDAAKAISATIELATGVTLTVSAGTTGKRAVLEDHLRDALFRVGTAAAASGRGVAFLYDEAHVLFDRERDEQFPLSALLGAFVQAQDFEDEDLPVMLGLGGLPSLVANLQAARSHSERLFKVEVLDNLSLGLGADGMSPAASALVKALPDNSPIHFDPDVAERVANDVNGYPYFIQWYGEALWDAADESGSDAVTHALYDETSASIQDGLDSEFFVGRYEEANRAEQTTLRVAASLGGETFRVKALQQEFKSLKPNAVQQSLLRLVQNNLIYRVRHGEYAYTAPLFGDYLRRRHPRHSDDR